MTALATTAPGYAERPAPGGLAEVADVIVDKGMVADFFVRVSPLGTETFTVDGRAVMASADAYLRFAAAVDRLVV